MSDHRIKLLQAENERLREVLEQVAGVQLDGESAGLKDADENGDVFEMQIDDAFDTLASVVKLARNTLK